MLAFAEKFGEESGERCCGFKDRARYFSKLVVDFASASFKVLLGNVSMDTGRVRFEFFFGEEIRSKRFNLGYIVTKPNLY